MLKQLQSPIIIVQDSSFGSILTTTNDILNQTELLRYSANLKGVDLDQFMQMTDEKDFKLYGIRKQRDCQKLSQIAQYIRSSSLTSSSSSFSQPESGDIDNADEDNCFLTPDFAQQQQDSDIPHLVLDDPEDTDYDTKIVEGVIQRIRSIAATTEEDDTQQPWPNSIQVSKPKVRFATDPPKYDNSRRFSLPSLDPPEYCEYVLDKRRNSYAAGSNTAPKKRSMKGKETLPRYSCSVQKMGKASAKIEFDLPGVRPRRRPWRDVYMELQGTVLKVYEAKDNSYALGGYHYLPTMAPYYQQSVRYTPLVNLSLSNAKVEAATDYKKKPNVFRITTENGPQVLFHVQTCAASLLWTEKISSGINIAVDLEYQQMPKFNTTVAFEEPISSNFNHSPTHQSYQGLVLEERQRRDQEAYDVLI
ncbi:Oxysterol-binding protein 3 [Mucor velutinosus]|uniref:Oxysterol-binding protein 3 n=1 Tax=Mucor velutinosus TaxID=708070 RepID=A0AAN7HLH3_9FUNG|nr:Oxysterol-binding protein 3 [Mucor velutinosus]